MPSARSRTARSGITAALGMVLLAACGGADDAPERAAVTSVVGLDAADLDVARAAFCDRVPGDAVAAALGGDATADLTWGNGDPAPGTGDVAHELGCSWTGPDGAAARGWVFARPVDAAFARTLVQAGRSRTGCTSPADPGFGTPSLTQVCALPGGTTRVRYAGLFGTTWLTCELSASGGPAAVRARASSWCAAVATAAAG